MMPTPLELLFLAGPLWPGLGCPMVSREPMSHCFSVTLIASRDDGLTVVGVLVNKGMDLRLPAGGICG